VARHWWILLPPARPSVAGRSAGKSDIKSLFLFPLRPTELRAHFKTEDLHAGRGATLVDIITTGPAFGGRVNV